MWIQHHIEYPKLTNNIHSKKVTSVAFFNLFIYLFQVMQFLGFFLFSPIFKQFQYLPDICFFNELNPKN
ncbi:hypothetical protein EGY07_10010 [Chryseobacterium indologenes]|nr:hypothetical protein CRN76_06830 [Chryseobacterium indologenes]AYY86109.1 hypothetical protein EGX91_16920 [Chryseobacterium indologenes]AYZ35879.1 hypothetical protein EGY07_10010 [Chryseobacterium indologenes]